MFKQALFSCGVLSFCVFHLTAFDQYPTFQEASFYNDNSQQQWAVAYEALKNIAFQGHEKILDVGCGSGKITANIAGRVPSGLICGLDLSQGMVAFAQDRYASLYKNLTFIKGDILDIPFSSDFDLIVSFSALHWILDHELLLSRLYHHLKPTGSILFTIPCTPFPEVAAIFQEMISRERWQCYLKDYHHPRRKFTPEEYTRLLEKSGFHRISVDQVPLTYYFQTKREFAHWFAAFSPVLFYIPKVEQENFLSDLVERYLESFPLEKDGQIVFKQNELIIRAFK